MNLDVHLNFQQDCEFINSTIYITILVNTKKNSEHPKLVLVLVFYQKKKAPTFAQFSMSATSESFPPPSNIYSIEHHTFYLVKHQALPTVYL